VTTLAVAILAQVGTLVVLVGWAIRKDRRLRRERAGGLQEE
jgi:hypothetical protein